MKKILIPAVTVILGIFAFLAGCRGPGTSPQQGAQTIPANVDPEMMSQGTDAEIQPIVDAEEAIWSKDTSEIEDIIDVSSEMSDEISDDISAMTGTEYVSNENELVDDLKQAPIADENKEELEKSLDDSLALINEFSKDLAEEAPEIVDEVAIAEDTEIIDEAAIAEDTEIIDEVAAEVVSEELTDEVIADETTVNEPKVDEIKIDEILTDEAIIQEILEDGTEVVDVVEGEVVIDIASEEEIFKGVEDVFAGKEAVPGIESFGEIDDEIMEDVLQDALEDIDSEKDGQQLIDVAEGDIPGMLDVEALAFAETGDDDDDDDEKEPKAFDEVKENLDTSKEEVKEESKEEVDTRTPEQKKLDKIMEREKLAHDALIVEAQEQYQKGLENFNRRVYQQALDAFNSCLEMNPDHAEARSYQSKCRGMLRSPRGTNSPQLQDRVISGERNKRVEMEMRLRSLLAKAETLYLKAVNPDEARRVLPRMDQISRGLIELEICLDNVRQVKVMLASSVLTREAAKNLRLRSEAQYKQAGEAHIKLISERDTLATTKAIKSKKDERMHTESLERDTIESLLKRGEQYYDKDQFEKAIEIAEKVISIDKTSDSAYSLRAKARSANHSAKAIKNDRDIHNAKQIWTNDIKAARVLPKEYVNYGANWEQVKLRVRRSSTSTKIGSGEQAIRTKLEAVDITAEFTEMSLKEVIEEIQQRCGVNIILSTTLQEEEIVVNLEVRSMNVLALMDWLMELHELSYKIEHSAVLIRKQSQAMEKVRLELYPVSDLTRPYRNFIAPKSSIGDDDDDDDDDDDEMEEPEVEPLPDRIRELIAPDSWESDERTSIDIWEDNLMVMQTPEVHAQIVNLLKEMREASAQQVMVEGRFLEVSDDFMEAIGIRYSTSQTMENSKETKSATFDMQILPGAQSQSSNAYSNAVNNTVPYGLHLGIDKALETAGALNPLSSFAPLLGFQFGAVLDAAVSDRKVSMLHNPKLLVANGKNAYVTVRTETSYIGGYTQQGANFQPEVEQYEQGVVWEVRPVISFDKKYITVRIRPRLTTLINDANSYQELNFFQEMGDEGPENFGVFSLPVFFPQIKTIDIESNATVPDGGTVLVGGEIRDKREEGITGIPVLSSMPGLGRLFRQEKRTNDGENRAIMVHAKILHLED